MLCGTYRPGQTDSHAGLYHVTQIANEESERKRNNNSWPRLFARHLDTASRIQQCRHVIDGDNRVKFAICKFSASRDCRGDIGCELIALVQFR